MEESSKLIPLLTHGPDDTCNIPIFRNTYQS
jgi:hypothetical protein